MVTVLCLDKPKDHVIFNCMHLCLCDDCAQIVLSQHSCITVWVVLNLRGFTLLVFVIFDRFCGKQFF